MIALPWACLARTFLLLGLLGTMLYCGNRAYRAGQPPSASVLDRATAKDAEELKSIAADRPRALAAFLRTRPGSEPEASCLARAAAATRGAASEPDFDLLLLADDPALCPTTADRDDFLQGHAAAVHMLRAADPSDALAATYLNDLKSATKDAAMWPAVRDDPTGLMLRTAVPNLPAADLAYYENNKDWLADLLPAIEPNPDDASATPATTLAKVISACRTYDPLPKNAATTFGPDGVVLFLHFGPMIRDAVKSDVHLAEVLEVVFANAEFLSGRQPGFLTAVYNDSRPIWDAAKRSPKVLWLYDHNSTRAKATQEKHPDLEVPQFLYEHYSDPGVLAPAAEAVVQLGESALETLARIAADDVLLPRFKEALKRHGWRVVLYVQKFGYGDATQSVTSEWLDKYFEKNGDPKEKDWISKIPIAAGPVDLIRNARNGTIELDEVGWAALDVADGALLVASFGGSAVLTVAKQAAKTGVKAGIRAAAKAGAKLEIKSVLFRAARAGSLLLSHAAGRTVVRGVYYAGNYVIKPLGRAAWRAAKEVRAGFAAMTPLQSKLLARSLLVLGLGVTLKYRTFPPIAAWLEKQYAMLAGLITAANTAATTLIAAYNTAAAAVATATGLPVETVACGGLAALSGAGIWWFFPRRRRGVRNV